MSFTSRDTAKAAKIFNEMVLDKNCSIFLNYWQDQLLQVDV